MSEQASLETEHLASPRWWWVAAGLLLLLLLLWLIFSLSGARPLKPLRATAVPANITLNGQPLLVNFDDLNDDPADYANLRVRVSGNYIRLPLPDCPLFNGPRIQWGLVADGLQLNAQGFEAVVLPIVADNTQMTLEGIWRHYPGPAGCGKEPANGLWYLEVEQIVQPNPLVAGTSTPVAVLSVTPPPFQDATATISGGQPPAIGTPIPNVTIVSTVVVGTPIGSPTVAGTAVPGTPTSTTTSTATATASATPGVGTPTVTADTLTSTPTPSGTPGSGTSVPTPTNPPLVTATPGDPYPAPSTPTPGGYP